MSDAHDNTQTLLPCTNLSYAGNVPNRQYSTNGLRVPYELMTTLLICIDSIVPHQTFHQARGCRTNLSYRLGRGLGFSTQLFHFSRQRLSLLHSHIRTTTNASCDHVTLTLPCTSNMMNEIIITVHNSTANCSFIITKPESCQ